MDYHYFDRSRMVVRWQQNSRFTEIVRSHDAPCKLFFRASARLYEHSLEDMAGAIVVAVTADRSWDGRTFLHSVTRDDFVPRWVAAGRDFDGVKEVRVTFQARIDDFHTQSALSHRLAERLELNHDAHPILRGIDDDGGTLIEQSVVNPTLCHYAPLPVQGRGPFAEDEWRALFGSGGEVADHCVGVYDIYVPGAYAIRAPDVAYSPLPGSRADVASWVPDCALFPLAPKPRALNVFL
jgi:hypothetical protein